MKTMKTIKALAIGLAAASAIVLAGCSTSGGSDSQSNWVPQDPTKVAGSINFWVWGDTLANLNKDIAAFNKVYPNIKVIPKTIDYSSYSTSLSAALASGAGPDTYLLEPGAMATQFGPLSEDLSPLAAKVLGSDWTSNISKGAVGELTVKDRLVGAPNAASGVGTLQINNGLLDQLGLTFPGANASFADLQKFCDKVNSLGKSCISIGAKDEWVSQDVFQAIANSIKPGAYYSAVSGKGKWTDPALVEAFTDWQKMFTDGVFQKGALGEAEYTDAWYRWLKEDAIATPIGTWGATDFIKDTNISNQKSAGIQDPTAMKTTLVPFPGVGGNPVKMFASVGSGTAINQNSKHKEAAAVWTEWYSLDTKGFAKTAADTLVGAPVLAGVKAQPSGLAYPDLVKSSLAFLTNGVVQSTEPRQIRYPQLVTALGSALQQSAAGTDSKTVAAQLESAAESVTR
jgi:raffinose/stachyose/melibiose transport system substrate-binding protein